MVGDSDKAELLGIYFESVFTADDNEVHDVKSRNYSRRHFEFSCFQPTGVF